MFDSVLADALPLHKFCPSHHAAERQAMREAADTGGVVLRVKSLRVERESIVLYGLIPSAALVFEPESESPGHLRPRSIGNLCLTRDKLLHANAGEEIGYLVLHTPVAVGDAMPESEDDDSSWVALTIQRTHHTLTPGFIGAVCCACCNRPIPQQRLDAVPNAAFCTACQRKKETK